MSDSLDGLTTDEREDFHVICLIAELQWSDFEVHVDCDPTRGPGRTGRRLVNALYKPSGRHHTYRAGTGNEWLTVFEEDIKSHCFTAWSRKTARDEKASSIQPVQHAV
jgi:hypothetical protein